MQMYRYTYNYLYKPEIYIWQLAIWVGLLPAEVVSVFVGLLSLGCGRYGLPTSAIGVWSKAVASQGRVCRPSSSSSVVIVGAAAVNIRLKKNPLWTKILFEKIYLKKTLLFLNEFRTNKFEKKQKHLWNTKCFKMHCLWILRWRPPTGEKPFTWRPPGAAFM